MKRCHRFYLAALVVLLAGGLVFLPRSSGQSSWKLFTSVEGNFSAMMPGTPTEETKPITTESGREAQQHNFIVDKGPTAYFVSYTEYPYDVEDSEQALDHSRDGFLKGIKGHLISERSVTISGYKGRAIKAQTDNEKYVAYLRQYVVKRRLYQVLIMAENSYTTTTMDDDFFTSFRLVSR